MMSTAAILQLIAFGLTESPVIIADIQALVAMAQKVNAAQTPTDEQAALAAAVSARQAAVQRALNA